MRAKRLLSREANTTGEFRWDGLFCGRCKEVDGFECQHDFDADPRAVWELVFCVHCGEICETRDVTHLYEAEALRWSEDSED